MYTQHLTCRACGYASVGANGIKSADTNERLLPVFSLGLQPLANDFVKPGYERAGYAPLEVLLCPRCHLAQLSVVVKPEILYSHYAYVTSASDTMRRHFDQLATDIAHEVTPFSVVEIGSNDGSLLSVLSERWGIPKGVLGIEPADNLVTAHQCALVAFLCGRTFLEVGNLLGRKVGVEFYLRRRQLGREFAPELAGKECHARLPLP